MAKFLQDILGVDNLQEVYTPFPEDERRFYKKHGLELGKEGEPPIKFPRFDNMYSDGGKYDANKLFKGATTTYDREKNRHGYSPGKDQEHYEEYVAIDEAHSKMQAKQAATYHGMKAKQRQDDVDAMQNRIINTSGHGKRARLSATKSKFERRRDLHLKAKKIAKRLSGEFSPLTDKDGEK